jgi:hypothetical protein
MQNKLPKNSVIIRVDFSDLRHGLDILIASASLEERKRVANMLVADVAKLPPCTALSDFVGALHPTLLFGDAPTPDIEQRFTDLVIAFAGYSASVLIARKHQSMAQAHGQRGGRGKMIGATVTTSAARDKDVHAEFEDYRTRASSDREAARNMELDHYIDTNGVALKYSAILKAVRRIREKNNN